MRETPLDLRPHKPPKRRFVLANKFFPSCMYLIVLFFLLLITPGFSLAELEMNSFGSARAIGEGGAYTAVTDNINSIFYNPAAVEFNSDQNYLIGYKRDISDATGYALGFTKKLTESDLIGFGVDNIELSGTSNGLMALSYARKLNEQFTLGLSAKRLYLSSFSFSGDSLSGNFGLVYTLNKNILLGLVIDNLIKTNFKTGVDSEEVVLPVVSIGVSYISDRPFFDRINVNFTFSQDEHYSASGFSGGMSVKIFGVKIWKGYSYSQVSVTPTEDYYNYFYFTQSHPWEEAMGIGIPISDNFTIEWSNTSYNLNVFSVLCKI